MWRNRPRTSVNDCKTIKTNENLTNEYEPLFMWEISFCTFTLNHYPFSFPGLNLFFAGVVERFVLFHHYSLYFVLFLHFLSDFIGHLRRHFNHPVKLFDLDKSLTGPTVQLLPVESDGTTLPPLPKSDFPCTEIHCYC